MGMVKNMKYKEEINGITVESNYPIKCGVVKDMLEYGYDNGMRKIIIDTPTADENWYAGEDTVEGLIKALEKLPKEMSVEYNYAGIGVEASAVPDYDEGVSHISFQLVVSE